MANASARSWRDIPQPVKPRAMSRGGRRRLLRTVLRTMLGSLFAAAIAWAAWLVIDVLRQNPPAIARTEPIRSADLTTNGVLDEAWLAEQLALPKGASLLELDLEALQARLLADGQVKAATLTRHFPDRLIVRMTERFPVARVMADWKGVRQPLLVARDGVIFLGHGYDPAMLQRLPWLDGVRIGHRDGAFLPIEGMEAVAELLARRNEAAPEPVSADPRRVWRIVSLERLANDRELEVRTAAGTTVVFAANGDFLRQLAKLDFLWDALAGAPPPARIDLTLGREVPVSVELPAIAGRPAGAPPAEFLPALRIDTSQ